ncbi:hypothetical protein BH23GEM3_BH23GEM3_02020 [soil metagenome]|jgi:anti-sigma factor RsiW
MELVAEDALPPDDLAAAAAHIEVCAPCAAEVEAYRTLFATMAALPSFAPSAAFSDAVMARVRIAHQPAALPAWLKRWIPSTRRGWMILFGLSLAPAIPMLALLAWILTTPTVSAMGLWQIGSSWMRDAGWSLLVQAVVAGIESGAMGWGRLLLQQLLATPTEILMGGALLLAVGIPVSAWTLYRTLRTPTWANTYAH